mmetsp:Transcript_8181/g.25774  ORF Transcript_8181/g.25774 Transcript_8181/m.25774 type:complete len:208 (-) Transcript_8181:43-666(-)
MPACPSARLASRPSARPRRSHSRRSPAGEGRGRRRPRPPRPRQSQASQPAPGASRPRSRRRSEGSRYCQGLWQPTGEGWKTVSTEKAAACSGGGTRAPSAAAARAKQMSSFRAGQGGGTAPSASARMCSRARRMKATLRRLRPPLPTHAGLPSSSSAQLQGAPTRSKPRKPSRPGRSSTASHSRKSAASPPRARTRCSSAWERRSAA